ncbi:MAG: HGGxSTG domain-containing protein [Deltaproteobacteria bacterium]|nr:HGGxSTG domain-containing protein [Deltaproteobacteria bacterium]
MRRKRFCGARTRKGTSCLCRALPNGRCKLHGRLSTGPRTPEGQRRALMNLRQFRLLRQNPAG